MKNAIKTVSFFSALALLTVITFSACQKKDNSSPTPVTPKGILYFHLHTDIDTTEVDSGVVAKDATGRHFQLNVAQFYMSGIVLHKADGSTYSIPGNVYILKNIATEVYLVDSVPTGNYTSVSFNIGIDAAANATNPSSYASSSVLSSQNPAMWFGSITEGYMFMNLQGLADTTASHTGPVNVPFSYQVGTSSMLKTVNMPVENFIIVPNQISYVHMIADYGKALSGVDFKTQMATPFVNAPVAQQIANNIPSMFRYEE